MIGGRTVEPDVGERRRRVGADPLVRTTVEVLHEDGTVAYVIGVMLRRFEDDEVELVDDHRLPLPSLAIGTKLRLRRAVSGDATYMQPVQVSGSLRGGALPLRSTGAWVRRQQRAHVRVAVPPVDVHLVTTVPDEDGDERVVVRVGHAMDLSAGGMKVKLDDAELAVGDQLEALFELPLAEGGFRVQTRARVVRVRADAHDGSATLGLQWVGVGTGLERRLTQWVFQQQARQVRNARG